MEDGTFYGEIPGFAGIVASGETLEACREQLQDVLEGWLIVGIRHGATGILLMDEAICYSRPG